jgi:Abnormal spindle-like microcephaly-assoc'd, ASPM-SPD-2-Hydin
MINARVLLAVPVLFVTSFQPISEAAESTPKVVTLPRVFEKNIGQAPLGYRFVSRHGVVESFLSNDGVDIVVANGNTAGRVRFRLLGSSSAVVPVAKELLPSVSNYLVGNDPSHWIRSIPNSRQVFYKEVYSGIDLVFHGEGDQLEHDFRIAAGADPSQVHFAIDGGHGIKVNSNGDIGVSLAGGTLYFKKPQAYQESLRGREAVHADFVLNADNSVRFRVGPYDHSRELVIDPLFSFSTYLVGSDGASTVAAVTTDSAGNIYVTGFAGFGFPIVNGIQPTLIGTQDAFISKLDPTGHTLLYSTYLGGAGNSGDASNYASAIALDPKGNIIIAGASSANDFPHAGKVPALTCQINDACFFVSSLTPDGSALNYSGLIGGIESVSDSDYGNEGVLAVDAAGNAYLAGVTDDANFQITPGTLSKSVPGYPYNSGFVLKVDSAGALIYCTIIPGTLPLDPSSTSVDVFVPSGISADQSGQATIAGTGGPGLPSTAGVVQPSFPNNLNNTNPNAGFVLQLNDAASSINYATYVPGTDWLLGMAADGSANLYLTGPTGETNLPASVNAYQRTIQPNQVSGYIVRMNGNGTEILDATYLEGTSGASFSGIALDGESHVFVGGMTTSTDFPLVDPFTSLWVFGISNADMVLAELSPDLSSLLFGSFLSSTDQTYSAPQFSGLAVDSKGNLLVVGETLATDFPTTSNSFEPTVQGRPGQYQRGFIAKLDMAVTAPSFCPASWSLNFGDVAAKHSATQVLNLTNCGNATLDLKSIISSAATVTTAGSCATVGAGATCPISVKYAPRDSSFTSATLTFDDDTAISPQTISVSGQGVAPQLSPSTGSFSFGHLLVNTVGAGDSLHFWNYGNAPLTISSVSVDGDFTITQDFCIGTLQPNTPCSMTITFSPTGSGIRTGTLVIVSNDPVYPKAGLSLNGIGDTVYTAPVITSLGSPTAQINNGSVTVQVYGANFYPASVLEASGKPQATTYLNDGEIQATLDSTAMDAIGEISLTVFNPSPGGGTSVSLPLTRYNVLNVDAAALTALPGSTLMYASIPSSASVDPNTVIPINPASGALGKPIAVGENPSLLASSSNGSYLFVISNQDQTVQRINLSTKSVDRSFTFPPNSTTCCGALSGTDIKGVPGSPQKVIVAFAIPGYGFGEMALYDDSGMVNYIPMTSTGTVDFSSFAYAGSTPTVYSLPFTSAQSPFFNVVSLTAHGLQYTTPACCYGGNNTTGAEVVSDGTLLYTSAGEVWNPGNQTLVGSFPVTTYNDTSYPNVYNLVMDTTSGHVFVIGDEPYQIDSSALVLSAYSQTSLALSGALAFPQVSDPLVSNLVRSGTDSFAFLAQNPTATSEAVYVLSSSLAKSPASNPPPTLESIAPTSAPQAGFGFQLTVDGAGFTEASVVNWNKVPLQTTFGSTTVLTAAVPAENLSSSGNESVTVINPSPGGGTSNETHFTVVPPTPLLSFSSPAAGFAVQKVGTASAAKVIAVQNPGTASLTISSITITGTGAASFEETNTCGKTLAAGGNCSLSIVFKPTSTGSLGASISFADNATGSPQAIAVTGTGD